MKVAKSIIYLTIILVIFFIILEVLFRTLVFFMKGSEKEHREIVSDSKFGWVHNTQMKTNVRINKCNEKVTQHPSKDPLINKYPKYTAHKKILFIGDSFTHAHEVSTNQAYFDVFEENTKGQYSVYAAGIGGFGNLQQYLVLTSIFEKIKPDIVMWQLHSNDVSNNVYELDNASFYNNQRTRPYLNLNNNQIKYKNPGFWLFDWSHGFRFIFYRLLLVDWKYQLGLLELMNSMIAVNAEEQEKYNKQGLKVLEEVLDKAMTEFPDTQFYGFSVNADHDEAYENIFIRNGAMYFSEFYSHVDNIERTNCLPLDGHWNHLGNKVAGDTLSYLLLEKTSLGRDQLMLE